MGKSGFLGGYARFCASGFGLGSDFAKAVGITVLIVTFVFVAAFYVIKWIVQFFLRRKAEKEAEAQQVVETQQVESSKEPSQPNQQA